MSAQRHLPLSARLFYAFLLLVSHHAYSYDFWDASLNNVTLPSKSVTQTHIHVCTRRECKRIIRHAFFEDLFISLQEFWVSKYDRWSKHSAHRYFSLTRTYTHTHTHTHSDHFQIDKTINEIIIAAK